MPPRAKYTRDEIVQIALDLVAAKGIDALNVRNLAAVLGTSTRPIFTAFKNMGELIEEVNSAAAKRFDEYASRLSSDLPAFKSVGMQMILFASEQPKLFQLLFMSDKARECLPDGSTNDAAAVSQQTAGSFEQMFLRLGSTRTRCLQYIRRDYGLNEQEAGLLFRSTWLFTFGICALIARGICRYDSEEVSDMLTTQFRSVMGLILSGKAFDKPEYQPNLSPQEFREAFI